MPELDTDPKMMRAQQNKDAREAVDQPGAKRDASDSDARSAEERKVAIAGKPAGQTTGASLHQNHRVADEPDGEAAEAGDDRGGLARPGRSRLGG